MSKFTVMLVDDDEKYSRALEETAYDDHDIYIKSYEDWESAFTELEMHSETYDAVILDGKGKLTADDPQSSMRHVVQAIRDLEKLESRGIYFPFIVNTGYLEQSDEILSGVKIFDKGDRKAMFGYLIEQMGNSELYKIRKKHAKVLRAFSQRHIPEEQRETILNTLLYLQNPDAGALQEKFNPLRTIMEAMFRVLIQKGVIDSHCMKHDKVNLKNSISYLNGDYINLGPEGSYKAEKAITPLHINLALLYIYNASNTLSHEYFEAKKVSPYMLESVLNALNEVLLWFVGYADQKHL